MNLSQRIQAKTGDYFDGRPMPGMTTTSDITGIPYHF